MQIHFCWETLRIFIEHIPLQACQKQMDAPWWIWHPLSYFWLQLQNEVFCISGLSNRSSGQRSSFPSLCTCSVHVNIHSRKQFKAQSVFFCVFGGTCPFITVFMSLSFRGLPKRFLVATAVFFFFGFFERGIWKSGSSFFIEHAITQIPMKLESDRLKHHKASYNLPYKIQISFEWRHRC